MAKEKIVKHDEKYDNTKFFIENGIDIDKRRIMIDEDITDISVGYAIRAIFKMIDADPIRPIDIYISSYGGSIYDGLALYDVLRASNSVMIRTHAIGKVMSMGFIIYLAGDERYAYPRTTFMNHAGYDQIEGKPFELKIGLKESERLENVCTDILVERTNKKEKTFWKRALEYKDIYSNVDEMIELGIVTHR